MDLLPSIDELQEQLVAHDLAVRQIIALDQYIEQQNDLSSLSETGDCPIPPFQQLIHTAVAEGIKRMYKEYRLQKWLKVQDMANTVRQVLNPESSEHEEQNNRTVLVHHGQQNINPFTTPLNTVRSPEHELTNISPVPSLLSRPPGHELTNILPVPSSLSRPPGHELTNISPVPSLLSRPPGHELTYISPVQSPLSRPSAQEMTVISPVPSPLSRLLSPISTPITDSLTEYRHHPDDHSSPIDSHRQLFPGGICPSTEQRPESSVIQQTDTDVIYSSQTSSSHTLASQQPFQNSVVINSDQLNTVNGPDPLYFHDNPDNIQDHLDDTEEIMDWESDFDDSEENLAGVLFATQQLLPEEQAIRLDVEMGDMGVGHVLFDRVSAAWQRYQCTYHRTS